MKSQQKSGIRFICLALLIVVMTMVSAGCLESTPDQKSPTTATHDQQSKNPAASTIVTTRTTTAPAPLKTTQSAPVSSTGIIKIDPISDMTAGEQFVITGTTSLPAGTNLFWQVRPDTGTPPTGIDMNSKMGIMANNQVTKGSGAANQVSLSVDAKDTKDLAAGKYVVLAVSLNGDPMTTDPTTGILAGYTYITLK